MHDFLELLKNPLQFLISFIHDHGSLVYALLFLIVFCETGLVVTPVLPGDSLLFAVGAVSAMPDSGLNPWYAGLILMAAAMLGDSTNYWIGRKLGPWLSIRFPKIVKPAYIEKTNHYFETYGGKTIIMARFIPIVRTFTPFVAGTGRMHYGRFLAFSISSAILWVGLVVGAGVALGTRPFFQKHIEMVFIAIVVVSILPMVVEFLKARSHAKKAGEV